jgi:hypothetical protein
MNAKKFFIGTLVGGIAFFFLGYLIYGLALNSFFMKHSTAVAGSMRGMADIIWWALILGNFAMAALVTYVLLIAGRATSFGNAAGTAASVGLFAGLSTDLIHYATANSFDLHSLAADVIVNIVMYAIAGGIIGAVLGMGGKKSSV